MGRYAGTVQNIAQRLSTVRHEKIQEAESVKRTAENIVGLAEVAEDLKAAVKAQVPDLDIDIRTSPWRKDGGEMVGSLFVGTDEVRVSIPFGGAQVRVNGRAVSQDAVMRIIHEEAFKLLLPYAERIDETRPVVILIRRFVRADREDKFLEAYRAQKPTSNPAFRGETLTKANAFEGLPPELQGLQLSGSGCVTYLNIARWDSWKEFAKEFAKQLSGAGYDPEIETAPRERAVLGVVDPNAKNKG